MITEIRVDEEFKSLIPPLTNEEREQLRRSLMDEGCREPIVVWGEVIIDGHNRYDICTQEAIAFDTIERSFNSRDDVQEWMIRNQFGRRNLSPAQRVELALRLEETIRAKAKANSGLRTDLSQNSVGGYEPVDTQKELAKLAGVSHDTVSKVKRVKESGGELYQDLLAGKVSVNSAYGRVNRAQKLETLTGTATAPSSKYRVVYADPPWQYSDKLDPQTGGGAERHYPTMSISELCLLPVSEWVEDDAVLFLWVTSPFLESSFALIKSWGFTYKSSFVWDKVKHNMGHYNSVRHEFLLVCTRGSCTPDERRLFDSVVTEEREAHSKKPETFREIIDTIYPIGKRLEMFARSEREGWDAYGNEV